MCTAYPSPAIETHFSLVCFYDALLWERRIFTQNTHICNLFLDIYLQIWAFCAFRHSFQLLLKTIRLLKKKKNWSAFLHWILEEEKCIVFYPQSPINREIGWSKQLSVFSFDRFSCSTCPRYTTNTFTWT